MSGFAGIVRIEPSREAEAQDRLAIERMAAAIAFRGPDAQQQTLQPGASFAYSLLTTGPAPQAAAHPCTVDGETWLLGDVRCDGRDDVILKLAPQGVQVSRTTTSEELILHYFAKFGAEALPELNGDFSFVLWNPRERRLLAFRDLTGARPFFYSHRGGVLIFGNTIQAVLCHPSISCREYELQFIADFLLGAPHHDAALSVYRDIRRLPPGHLLEFSCHGLAVKRIGYFPIEDLLHFRRDEEVIEQFRTLFMRSVADCLPDCDTSILLSGGLDSTSIAAAVTILRSQKLPAASSKLRALCVDFQPLFDDRESQFASGFAETLGIPLRLIHSGDALPFSGWEDSAASLPEPLEDPYSLLYLSYRQEVSRTSRVVLSGDGGDEVLRLQAAPFLRYLLKQRGPMVALRTLARWVCSQGKLPSLGFGLQSRLHRIIGRKPAELTYPPWLAANFEQSHKLAERWLAICSPPSVAHPFNTKAYHAVNSGFLGDVLEVNDPVWTGVALETRNPFLDRRLCRFLLRIPVIPWALDKQLLRSSQVGILPDEIRLRAKTPMPQDPLVLQVASGDWNPVPSEPAAELVRSLVDWPNLLKSLKIASDTSLYVHLRPVSLSRWLNAVEKAPGIQ